MKNPTQHAALVQVNGIWRLRVRLNGVHRSIEIGNTARYSTRAKAQDAADKLLRDLVANPKGDMTIAKLIEKFDNEEMPENQSTAHHYRSLFRRIEMQFGHVPVTKFGTRVVEVGTWLNNLKREDGKQASSAYKAQMRSALSTLLDKAMYWQLIPITRNPVELVKLKESVRRQKELVILTPEQYRQLLNDPDLPLMVKTMIQITAGLGMRISEVLGLKWTDIDIVEKSLHIGRSMVKGVADKPKTESSERDLPLHDSLVKALIAWRMAESIIDGWVFGSKQTGSPYDRDYLRDFYLIPAGERIGVKIGWHSLRHANRAWMRTVGASAESQKNMLGHSNIATTMDVYGGKERVEALRPVNAAVMEMLEGAA